MKNEASTHKWSNFIMRCLMMILGALIYTIGLDLFLVPNNIIDGGVVGISLMAAELSGISFSISSYSLTCLSYILAIELMAKTLLSLHYFLSYGWQFSLPLLMILHLSQQIHS